MLLPFQPEEIAAKVRRPLRKRGQQGNSFCKKFRVGERCCEFECLDPPGEDEMYQARLRKRAEILAGNGANGLSRSGGWFWSQTNRAIIAGLLLVALVQSVTQRLLMLPS
uniref:Uncharacterized protein n=1 Tax=Anopheles christyi TaxID=43041 RepID=A0A182JQN2_9DIPT